MPRTIQIPGSGEAFKRGVEQLIGEIEDWSKIRHWVLYAWNRGVKELFKDPSLNGWDPLDPVTNAMRRKRQGYYGEEAPERGAIKYPNLWTGRMRNELALQRSLSRATLRGVSERFRPFTLSSELNRVPYAKYALGLRPFTKRHEKILSLTVDQYVNFQLLKNYERLTGG